MRDHEHHMKLSLHVIVLSLQILNVDFSHIEARVADLLKQDRSLILLNGELIDR